MFSYFSLFAGFSLFFNYFIDQICLSFRLCAPRSRGWGCGQCPGCPECPECAECAEDRRTPRAKRRSTQSDHRHIDPVGHDEDGE